MDFSFSMFFTYSCNILISSPYRVMSSIDFTNFLEASENFTGMADGIFVVVVLLTPMRGDSSSGITTIYTLCYFSLTKLSSSYSISFICSFCSIISFDISSLWPSLSTISFAFESSVAQTFNCFLRDVMSSFFFYSSSLATLKLDGS
jgi:hypothetical protein